jgi:hypothetical protein
LLVVIQVDKQNIQTLREKKEKVDFFKVNPGRIYDQFVFFPYPSPVLMENSGASLNKSISWIISYPL